MPPMGHLHWVCTCNIKFMTCVVNFEGGYKSWENASPSKINSGVGGAMEQILEGLSIDGIDQCVSEW